MKWAGGKRQLLPELLKAVDKAGAFKRYHEPFLGAGALFFALVHTARLKDGASLSDINPNLMDAYLGVRDEVETVISALKEHRRKHCESYYYEVRASEPRSLARRAARIIYLNRTCFNGLYRENSKGEFNVPFGKYHGKGTPPICDETNLRAVSETLKSADVGAKSFDCVLETAEPGDLVYFDPPYTPVSKTAYFTSYARDGFGADAQIRLAEVFAELARRGVKVVLSNSMTAFTRDLYKAFHCHQVLAHRFVNSKADRRGQVPEALITNFPLTASPRRIGERADGQPVQLSLLNGDHERMALKRWLVENDYADVASLIDKVQAAWQVQGKRTRRNWWEILAGDARGDPRSVAGQTFPVLRAAQLRQGVPVTSNALCRNPWEKVPA